MAYRPDIDGLRALAVLGVVFYHAYPTLVPGGFSGVDIFFVISGYLISGVILKDLQAGTFSVANFYAHRVRRIFPGLVLVLVVSWALAWLYLIPKDFTQFAKSMLGGVGFYANFTHAGSDYFQAPEEARPLLHLWSLGVEEQFYLLWPLILWITWRRQRHSLARVIGIVLFASFFDCVISTPISPKRAFYFPDTRLWELALGGGLAYLVLLGRLPRLKLGWLLQIMTAAALAGSMIFLNADQLWPGWRALLPACGTALALAIGPGSWLNRAILSSQPALAIGKISYPLYLWHWPLLVFGRAASWSVAQVWIDGAALLLSLGLAALTYRIVERPVRFGPARTIFLRTFGPLAAMAVPALLAATVLASKGLPARFPKDMQTVLAASQWKAEGMGCFDAVQAFRPLQIAGCVDPKSPPDDNRPLVLLWGDSHAFALYAGLKDHQRRSGTFRLATFSKGSCPFFAEPELAGLSKGCLEFNSAVREQIRSLKPDILVLDSFWASAKYFRGGLPDERAIHAALLALDAEGIPRIVIVGTVPVWKVPQPQIIVREWLRNAGKIPERSTLALSKSLSAVDAAVLRAAKGTRAKFVPLLEKLCNGGGCLLMSSERVQPMQLDGWHLTEAGSRFVIGYVAADILGAAQ